MQHKYVVTRDHMGELKSRQYANPLTVYIAAEVKKARQGWTLRIEQSDKPLTLIPNLVP